MHKVVAISAGMLVPKKGNEPFRRAHRYLNYGLLGLASAFNEDVPVYHGNFDTASKFLSNYPEIREAKIVLLSLPSFYAVKWAATLVNLLFSGNNKLEIHIGGRWVIDQNWEYIASQFPRNVTLHKGMGELKVARWKNAWFSSSTEDAKISSSQLNYNLLMDRHAFQPSVEVSRGCGLGCAFCEEANERLTPMKQPDKLLNEIESILSCYGSLRNFYFESSMFAPSISWVQEFSKEYNRRGMSFKWRTESRVDVLDVAKIAGLADSGLCILDLGLESAAPSQILNMGKSKDPIKYLRKAREILAACEKYGVKAKVNILLYPGETRKTVSETRLFLTENRTSIFGVSTYPVVVYGIGERAKYFDSMYQAQGAHGIRPTETDGVWDVELSKEIDAVAAKEITLEIAQSFMSAKNYFELKQFSYLDQNYSWNEFLTDFSALEAKNLPFGN